MKLKKILLGLAYMSVMASCADLDYHEYTVYDKDYVFTDFGRTGAVVTNIYSYLDYDLPSEVSYCSACDEAQFAWSWSSIHDWINGAWSSTNSHSLWNYYSGIRDANFFLEESQNADFSELKEDKNYVAEMNRFNRYKYEVRFLRAYFYFNLVRAYGDIPLVTKVLTEEEANQVKRTPAAEVFDFIIKECDEIADELPVDYSKLENDAANGESPETGRITKQAVLALKARTLLYQASPAKFVDNVINILSMAGIFIPFIYFILMFASKKVSSTERKQLLAYLPLFLSSIVFWLVEEQSATVIAVWGETRTNLHPTIFGINIYIDPSWYQLLNPLFIVILTPLFVWIWNKMGERQPSAVTKFGLGLLLTGVSYMIMTLPGMLYGTNNRVSFIWLVVMFAVQMAGELLVSPVGLSVSTRLAPLAFQSQMVALWFLADSTSQAVNALITPYFTKDTEVAFFGILGLVCLGIGALLLLIKKPILNLMRNN